MGGGGFRVYQVFALFYTYPFLFRYNEKDNDAMLRNAIEGSKSQANTYI